MTPAELDALEKRLERNDAQSGMRSDVKALLKDALAALRDLRAERDALEKELDAMRFLAANPHAIQKVKDELGPLSLWSQSGLEAHVKRQIDAALAAQEKL